MRVRLCPFATAWSLAFAVFVTGATARAHEPPDEASSAPPPESDTDEGTEAAEVTVAGERPESEAASRIHVTRRELELRPKRRPGDIFEAVPGLFAVQHAGGGKANQWFLRGFDADHGTDVAFFVDGVPVNLVSHGH